MGTPQVFVDERRDVNDRISRASRAFLTAAAENLELALARCGTGFAEWDKNAPGDESPPSPAGAR